MTDDTQDAAGETWEVTTTGGPIKCLRGDQEFDLSRVVGRWAMRDYLNALTREAAAAHNEAEMWHLLADMSSIEHESCHDEAAHYRREELQREAADLRRENEALRSALRGLVAHEDQPCRFDHNGYCQEHFVTLPCTVAAGRDLLGLSHSSILAAQDAAKPGGEA